jgi:AcrR family transcriptional regulator
MNGPANQKERIIARADERFLKEGFARISVDDLTSDLSMSKKTFYKIFRSKEDLVEQIIMRALACGPFDRTRARADHHSRTDHGSDVDSPPSRDESNRCSRRTSSVTAGCWAKSRIRRNRMTTFLTGIFEQGKTEGYIRSDVPIRLLVLCVIAAVQAIVRPLVLAEESFSSRGGDRDFHLVLRGALPKAAGRRSTLS